MSVEGEVETVSENFEKDEISPETEKSEISAETENDENSEKKVRGSILLQGEIIHLLILKKEESQEENLSYSVEMRKNRGKNKPMKD